jgi:hypothetical protein
MRFVAIGSALVAALVLGGCARKSEAWFGDSHHGRYVGIGLYSPGKIWTKLAGYQAGKAPAAANLRDDDVVIVVTDSDTGEIRACGNLSGFCIGQNPWKSSLPAAQQAPLPLTTHQEDSDSETAAAGATPAAPAAPSK